MKMYSMKLFRLYCSYTLKADGVTCDSVKLEVGVGYTFIIDENNQCSSRITLASPSLSLIWQAPQYALITAGEVMFSVTGLEFSYSQAPMSMKSVLQAGWLLTVAIGNLFVVIVAKVGLQKQVGGSTAGQFSAVLTEAMGSRRDCRDLLLESPSLTPLERLRRLSKFPLKYRLRKHMSS